MPTNMPTNMAVTMPDITAEDIRDVMSMFNDPSVNSLNEIRDCLIELKASNSKIHSEIRSVILEKNIEQVKSDPTVNELVRLLMSLFTMLEENSRVIETEDYYSFYVKEPIALTRNKYELLKKYKEKL